MCFDDTVSDAIANILQAVGQYNEYSKDHKKRTINALTHLYLIMYESFPPLREEGEPPAPIYGIKEAKAQATREWNRAYTWQD